MNDRERIDNDDGSLFGLGLAVGDILFEDLPSDQDAIVITPLREGEEVDYNNKLEEIRTICKNEEFILTSSRFYFPFEKRFEKKYWELKHDEIVLVKEIDLNEEAPNIEDSAKIGKTLKDLEDYLQLQVRGLYFFFYFPENIIIDRDGEFYSRVIMNQTPWEHIEEFGEEDEV